MKYTTNYNLKKPEGSDTVNIEDINDNMDTLDSQLSSHIGDFVREPAFLTASSDGNNYTASSTPSPASYVDGIGCSLKADKDSTGDVTLNWNGLGAKALKDTNGNDVKLKAGGIYTFRYNADAGNFVLQGSTGDANTLNGKTSEDFATAAQGEKADNALPASSYTAGDVLSKIKAVGGVGSGLDADLLDGKHAGDFALGKSWTCDVQNSTWSRLFKMENESIEGHSFILTISATRTCVVYNATFQITSSHDSNCNIVQLNSTSYSAIKIRGIVNFYGDGYIEIYDDNDFQGNNNMQSVNISLINLKGTPVTTYSSFTDGTTIPSGYIAAMTVQSVTGNTLVGNLDGNATTVGGFSASGTPNTTEKSNIIGMVNELFQSGTNGKNDIYNAISAKGTTPAGKDFSDLVSAIGNISTGKKFASGKLNFGAGSVVSITNLTFIPSVVTATLNYIDEYGTRGYEEGTIYDSYNSLGSFHAYSETNSSSYNVCSGSSPISLNSNGFTIKLTCESKDGGVMYWTAVQ